MVRAQETGNHVSTQTLARGRSERLYSQRPDGENDPNVCLRVTGNKMWSTHVMEYFSVRKRKEAQTRATTGMDLGDIMIMTEAGKRGPWAVRSGARTGISRDRE